MIIRESISGVYLRGTGIEIGAHHNPQRVRKDITQVHYVDKRTKRELIEGFPEITNVDAIPETDIIDDGQYLKSIEDETYDFVISSHQLEHCSSPLTAIKNHLRVIKPGGIIFYAIPDHTNPIDKDRQITQLSCLVYDEAVEEMFAYGASSDFKEKNLIKHYCEYFEYVDKLTDKHEQVRRGLEDIRINRDIHFHCWDSTRLIELFHFIANRNVQKPLFDMELFYRNGLEYFVVLKKN